MATTITEKLIIDGAGSKVVLDGLDFTSGGFVDVYNADEVVVKNCRVYGIVPNAAKSFWMNIHNDIPVKVVVENCFFGNNPNVGANKVYNLLEMTAKLNYGSSISNNYFKADCCTHNTINLYGLTDNAEIKVNGNVFESSAGTIRVGVKGAVPCNIYMNDNNILANNTNYGKEDWGLLTIQPYGKQTSSFEHMTIIMKDNIAPCEQIAYAGYGSDDTAMTDALMPKVIINGKIASIPIYRW